MEKGMNLFLNGFYYERKYIYVCMHSDVAEVYSPTKAEVSAQAVSQCHDQQNPHFLQATI